MTRSTGSHEQISHREAPATAFGREACRVAEPWLDALCELPPSALREIGRLYMSLAAGPSASHDAQRRLARLIGDKKLDVDAWLIRDQVETICHVAAARDGNADRTARRELLSARVAAEWAALAIGCARHLHDDDVATLTAPFATTIPTRPLRVV